MLKSLLHRRTCYGQKVLIADDSYFMRQMLKNIINEIEGFEVISTASDGREAVENILI